MDPRSTLEQMTKNLPPNTRAGVQGTPRRQTLELVGQGRVLGGARRVLHNVLRSSGLSWRPIGLIVVTNTSGSDGLVWASSGTGTQGNAVRLSNPVKSARLVIQNDGGSCDRLANIQPDGQVLYTGVAPIPSAHALVGKTTGIFDPLDKDVGIPVGDVDQTFDMQLYLSANDSAIISLNGYTKVNIVDVDNDDDAPGAE